MDITTVADDLVVIHDGAHARRYDNLAAATDHVLDGVAVRTLPRPDGALLCKFATVNDLHFGEDGAGRLGEHSTGPVQRVPEGADPYPEVMNRAAATEIATIDPNAVVVKGDLSVDGLPEEWAAFEDCYRTAFADRLHVVRGNHDGYHHQDAYAGDQIIELSGITIALLDTTIPGMTTGEFTSEQAGWLDQICADADGPVIALGHHQQWIGRQRNGRPDPQARRSDAYFGVHPDGSDRLDDVAANRSNLIAYAAGHTHRHRVRRMARSQTPTIEVGCTKDFPGTWAEYRVYEGGVMQVVHRMSSPEALAWSERCRRLYEDDGVDYETYALGTLSDRCFTIDTR